MSLKSETPDASDFRGSLLEGEGVSDFRGRGLVHPVPVHHDPVHHDPVHQDPVHHDLYTASEIRDTLPLPSLPLKSESPSPSNSLPLKSEASSVSVFRDMSQIS